MFCSRRLVHILCAVFVKICKKNEIGFAGSVLVASFTDSNDFVPTADFTDSDDFVPAPSFIDISRIFPEYLRQAGKS